ncbi:unnamed protein product [Acanthoscelides obtectus]|uniref:Uncharacterized protein n=1 Tax=Acanthoscelides obtectus TaxID=200917 RepID=A0A9P0Q6C7_ACAOB|nr:unnamed protein product [Acanthoscelides obtectus]CAK1646894.1 hypothetical protein AOBTE_LOCUS14924 [Acanthoscelides obtectus]
MFNFFRCCVCIKCDYYNLVWKRKLLWVPEKGTLTGERYVEFMSEILTNFLDELDLISTHHLHFQQDGAPAHNSRDILGVISTVPGLFWRCKNCIPNCIVINQDDVKNLLSGKIDEAMASFKNQVTKLSADISRSMKSSHAVPSVNKPVVSYAEVVRNKTQPAG